MREARGFWSTSESRLHIGLLELRAIVRLVETYAGVMMGHRVRLLCDNERVVYIINKGTSKAMAMMAEARTLWRLDGSMHVMLGSGGGGGAHRALRRLAVLTSDERGIYTPPAAVARRAGDAVRRHHLVAQHGERGAGGGGQCGGRARGALARCGSRGAARGRRRA